jgi:hypothetical protein
MKTADISAVLTSAQLLLSMVETRQLLTNGDGADPAAPQELARIGRQLGKLESLDGQSSDVRREIDLRQRVTALRNELSHREPGSKLSWPATLNTLFSRLRRRYSPISAKSMATGALPTTRP